MLNDLWRYDPQANNGYFVNGKNIECIWCLFIWWISWIYTARFSLLSNDSIILYGGQGYALNQIGMLNDVWRYDSQSNLWLLSKDLKWVIFWPITNRLLVILEIEALFPFQHFPINLPFFFWWYGQCNEYKYYRTF